MSDLEIGAFLATQGFVGAAAERARDVLEAAHLTRPGKLRLSTAKLPRASALLRDRLVRVCQRRTCHLANDPREAVEVPAGQCEICRGSANRRAGELARRAMLAAGFRHLLVIGGSPMTHAVLAESLGTDDIEVRCIDGTQGLRATPTVEADLDWADVMVVLANTPLPHKVSRPYTSRARGHKPWITVARRSVEAVCTELTRLSGNHASARASSWRSI
jgi:hypothetical protein